MGFLNQQELDQRLELTKANFSVSANLKPLNPGAFNTGKRLGFEEKVLIGVLANFDTQKNVAQAFGVQERTAKSLEHGESSWRESLGEIEPRGTELKERITSGVQAFKDKIQTLASGRLVRTLENITDEKLDGVDKVKDLALIASSLAKVNASVLEQGHNGNAIQINLYRPRTRDEQEYDVIEVKE